MSYKVSKLTTFHRDFKGLTPQMKEEVLEISDEIIENPTSGEPLRHSMKGFSKYSFNRKPEYRLIYAIYNCLLADKNHKLNKCHHDDVTHYEKELASCEGLIEFIWVKTREECNNLYSQDKKYHARFKRKGK
jgi:mRNA-degrading endonuclease RelE of RelBE toxin-antitoxin system